MIKRRGGNTAYGSAENHGYPCLLQRVAGVWKVIGEPIAVQVNFGALEATGILAFTDAGKAHKVLSIRESHQVAETSAGTANLKAERCQGTEAVTQGDDLLAATGVNLKAAANTPQNGTVLTTSSIDVLAAGDRLMLHAALDNATAQALTEYRGGVTIRLVPVTLDTQSQS